MLLRSYLASAVPLRKWRKFIRHPRREREKVQELTENVAAGSGGKPLFLTFSIFRRAGWLDGGACETGEARGV